MPASATSSRPAPEPDCASLRSLIDAEIRTLGPMPVDRYMALANGHPVHGAYSRGPIIGQEGAFVTAPEISQMFGELLGLWLAEAWRGLGSPPPPHLIELGPGRGTLIADLLRATAAAPGFSDRLALHLVEPSAPLREQQKQALDGRIAPDRVTWHEQIETVPDGPWLLVANEVLDVLPVRQFVRHDHGWCERRIGLDPAGRLAWVVGALAEPMPGLPEAPPGAIHEIGPDRQALARHLAGRLARDQGVAVVIDYGGWPEGATGDTLQAVRSHQGANPLSEPGEADLSTQVDVAAFARAAAEAGAAVYGPVPQGAFLRALGIEARALKLMAKAGPAVRHEIRSGLFRLTDASAMGEAFKVLVLAPPKAPAPPGFRGRTL